MNQRPAKMYNAAARDDGKISLMELRRFAESASGELLLAGEKDAAHYFEQMADFIAESPQHFSASNAARILGL